MRPFFFGESGKNLYGVYHPPTGSRPVPAGVVLCYPFGFEYMTSHRAFRQLAKQLSRGGFHVLRFDYFGTGDSAGNGEDASIGQWLEDVGTAVEELRDMASLQRVSLMGFKLGGALAAVTASRTSKVEDLVLWEPVIRGSEYLEEILLDSSQKNRSSESWLGGFPLTSALVAEIKQLDLVALSSCNARRAAIISDRGESFSGVLTRQIQAIGVPTVLQRIDSADGFGAGDGLSTKVLEPAVQEAIVGFLSGYSCD